MSEEDKKGGRFETVLGSVDLIFYTLGGKKLEDDQLNENPITNRAEKFIELLEILKSEGLVVY